MKCDAGQSVNYYITKARFLSMPFEQQYRELPMLGDYITDDMANDWLEEDIPFLEELEREGAVGAGAAGCYRQILQNLSDASPGGASYEGVIWTLEGLRTHDFWDAQRKLAEKLLRELTVSDGT